MRKYIPTIVGWLVGAATLFIGYAMPHKDGMVLAYGAETAALIMAIAAAAVTTGVAIRNSISAKRSKNAADRTIGGLKAENASNYYSDYYRGALDNDSTRAYLKRLDAAMKKNNRSLDNSIVSAGATTENALAQKQARNEVMGSNMAQAVAAEDARKERVRNSYFNNNKALTMQQLNTNQAYEAEQRGNLAGIASGISTALSAYGAYMGGGGFGGGGAAGGGKAMRNYRNYQSQTLKTNGMTRPQVNSAYRNNSVGYSGIAKSGSGYGPSVGLKTEAQLQADRNKMLGR